MSTTGRKKREADNMEHINGICELTLRAKDGRERRELVWLPTDAVRKDFYDKARRNGLEIIEH